jgi:hypothetical protein
MILGSGCDSLGLAPLDTPATLEAEGTALSLEVTGLRATLDVRGTQVAATAVAAATYVTELDGINRQMVATLRAAVPPTQQIVQGRTGAESAQLASAGPGTVSPGIITFTPTQIASAVSASDGCAQTIITEFGTNAPIIYATTRAFNMRSGTEMSSEWTLDGQVVYTFAFTVDVDDPDYCLWFSITPQDVAFTPGQWSVRILANGAPISPPAALVIVEGM